jgi:hypothetical protein
MIHTMTAKEFAELARLCRKARFDESQNINEDSKETLQGVEIWASRRAG